MLLVHIAMAMSHFSGQRLLMNGFLGKDMNVKKKNKQNKIVVPLNLICDAIEAVDDEWNQYLDIEKMEVVSLPQNSFLGEYDEEDQELADLIEEEWGVRFFGLPSKFAVNEYSLMENFIWSLPEGRMQDSLESAIRGKGAFRRFKDAVYRFGIEQQWYDFEAEKYREIAIEWCENKGFEYSCEAAPQESKARAADLSEKESKASAANVSEKKSKASAANLSEKESKALAANLSEKKSKAQVADLSEKKSKASAVDPSEKKSKVPVADLNDGENLAWEEIRMEHIVQDEWIDFRRSAYRFPDGSIFEPFYSYSRRDYVVIVASDEKGNYLCVRQFRQGIKKVTTEFPAGGIERTDGREYGPRCGAAGVEDALEAAKRELLEETGYVSEEWKHLLTVPSNPTMSDNYAHVFAAVNCRKSGAQNLDETEFLNVRKYSAAEIEEMIAQGNFQQAVHIMAWLLAQRG